MRRGGWLLTILAIACGETLPPGQCRVSADCAAGEQCEGGSPTVIGSCVQEVAASDGGCSLTCGEGLVCVSGADGERCQLASGATFGLSVTSPTTGAFVSGQATRFECVAASVAPERVFFVLRRPEGLSKELTGTRDGASFTTSWTASAADPEGAWSVECRGELGPTGRAESQVSSPVSFVLDRTAPLLAHAAPLGWFKFGATATLLAEVSDAAGGGGVASVSVLLGGQRFGTTTVTDGRATVPVLLDGAVTTNAFTGALPYSIEAEDAAGNVTRREGLSLQVDAVAPVATIVVPANWSPRASFAVDVTMPETGAPFAVGGVVLESLENPSIRFTTEMGGYRVPVQVDASRFAVAGEERSYPFVAKVTDAAGNTSTSASAELRVDAKGPTVEVLSEHDYFRVGTPVTLRFTLDDASGVDAAQVSVLRGGTPVSCTRPSEGTWSCTYTPTGLEAVATGDAVVVVARDLSGNESRVETVVRLDSRGPVITPRADTTLYGPEQLVTIEFPLSDDGVGLDDAHPPTLQFPGGPAVAGVPAGGGLYRFGPRASRAFLGEASGGGLDRVATIVARDLLGNSSTASLTRGFDFQPPTGTLLSRTFPAFPIAAEKLLRLEPVPSFRADPSQRRDRLQLFVRFEDTFMVDGNGASRSAGLGFDNAYLAYTRVDGSEARLAPVQRFGNEFSFDFFAGDAQLTGQDVLHEWSVSLRPSIVDRAGNAGGPAPVLVQVTREASNTAVNGTGWAAAGGVAIRGEFGYVASAENPASPTASNMRRIQLVDGGRVGNARIPGLPFGTPVAGASTVWMGSIVNGTVSFSGMRPEVSSDLAPLFTCATTATSAGTPALLNAAWDTGGAAETLIAPLADGRLVAMRRNGAGCDTRYDAAFAGTDLSRAQVAIRGNQLYVTRPNGTVSLATIQFSANGFLVAPSSGPTGAAPAAVRGLALAPGRVFFASGAQPYFTDVNLLTPVAPVVPGLSPAGASVAPIFSGAQEVLFAAADRLLSLGTNGQAGLNRFLVNAQGAAVEVTATPLLTESPTGRITYVATSDLRIAAYDEDGNRLWSRMVDSAVTGAPKLGCNGFLYVATSGGRVHMLATDSTAVAVTPWPQWQHDNGNTGNLDSAITDCAP